MQIWSRISAVAGPSTGLVLRQGCGLFWNNKCDCSFVERLMVRVLQFEGYFVRARRKAHQDDGGPASIRPDPRGIVKPYVDVSDSRRFVRDYGSLFGLAGALRP